MTSKKIRFRHRRGYVRESQSYTAWTEYQIVEGRKVLGRYDFLEQAAKAHPDAVPDKSATS